MYTKPLETRFWSKVHKTEGCWLWTASRRRDGYGYISVYGMMSAAHRVAWRLSYGDIPPGLFVLHHCDNKVCVRPDHLFLGTQKDNVHDAISKGRLDPAANARLLPREVCVRAGIESGKKKKAHTHCPHGHPYSGDNLYIRPQGTRSAGSRECRECMRIRDRIRYAEGGHRRKSK